MAGARRWILRPCHATVEPGHAHFEIAFILFEDCQVAQRRHLAVQFAPQHILAARHEVEDVVGEEVEPVLEFALVQEPGLADVELHQLEPKRLLRGRRHRRCLRHHVPLALHRRSAVEVGRDRVERDVAPALRVHELFPTLVEQALVVLRDVPL